MPKIFSRATKLAWLPRRPLLVGLTSFCYALPFAWGAWPPWLLQTFLSFQSDFAFTGKDSYYHAADRLLASTHVLLFVSLSAATHPPWYEVAAAAGALGAYAVSVVGIRSHRYHLYHVAHTAWHVLGGAGLVSVASRHCDFTLDPQCREERAIVFLPCACGGLVVYAELALFACAVACALVRLKPFREVVAVQL